MNYFNIEEFRLKLKEMDEIRNYFDSDYRDIFDYNEKMRDIYYNMCDDEYYENIFVISENNWFKYFNELSFINFRFDGMYFDGFDLLFDYEGDNFESDNLILFYLKYYNISKEEYIKEMNNF